MSEEDPFIDSEGLELVEYGSLAPVYEEALLRSPRDVRILEWLGQAYTRLGRFEEGLGVDLQLAALRPEDPAIRYNLACSYALLGRTDEAFDALESAIRMGYRDLDHLRRDEDLRSLRADPRFRSLLERRSGPT